MSYIKQQGGFNNIYKNTTAGYQVGYLQNEAKFFKTPSNSATNSGTVPLPFGCPINVSTAPWSLGNNDVNTAIASQAAGVVNAFTIAGSTAIFDPTNPNSVPSYAPNADMLIAQCGSGLELILPVDSTLTGGVSLTQTLYITPFDTATGTGGVVTTTSAGNLVLPTSVKLKRVLGTSNTGYAPIIVSSTLVGFSQASGVSVASFEL